MQKAGNRFLQTNGCWMTLRSIGIAFDIIPIINDLTKSKGN